ncbi:MAG: DUF3667 domain-containing protein [Aquidulcibacter sp.]|uniref:DUF3667 domain-containing protein n=1 Tax=Aquidulcibacter sp. TaxID=2052990 RepID=UPI0022CA0B97|nr:DUF3667 domain-containing protein [Aquidulcibacter sp.]
MDGAAELNLENSGPLAVDAASGSAGKHRNALIGTACKNCGTMLAGDYCHACGQTAHVHRSFLHVLEEVVHGITHVDSKTWRSLPMLIFRPGTMTRNYVMGHRNRYVPPATVFLGSIFAMFLVFAFVGGPGFVKQNTETTADRISASSDRMTTALEDLKEARADLKLAREQLAAEKAKPIAEQNPVIVRNGQEEVKAAATALEAVIVHYRDAERDVAKASTATPDVIAGEIKEKRLSEPQAERKAAVASGDKVAVAAVDAATALVKASPTETPKGEAKNITSEGEDFQAAFAKFLKEDVEVDTPWPTFNKKLKHKFENPELFLYKLQNTVYKFSFLLIPISLPFIWLLLFWKRGVTLYDHAVFALYSVSFMSFLFLALALTSHWVDWSQYSGWIFLAVLCHTFFQFKGAYALGWFSAFWRTTIFVFVFAPITLGLFFTSIIVLGAVG